MKKLLCAAVLLCAAITVHASDTSFFATVTDTDGQVWLNGTWNASLSLPSGPFGNQTPTVGGVPVPTKKKGIINAFGQIVTTLTDTSSLDQAGGVWAVQACPNASTADYADTGCVTVKSAISGSTVDLTSRFTGVVAPRFPAGPNAYGYSDIEVLTPSVPGEQYYNTGNNLLIAGLRIWDGKTWQGVGAGGGGGAANPAGQDQDVQINKTVGEIKQFNADPGRFTYNNTTHMLKSNANGDLNPDLYSGTNGIATALASSECSGSCVVTQPITTTDTAAVPAPTADQPQVVDSLRNGSWMRFWHNPGYNNSSILGGTAVGHYDYGTYDTPNPLTSSSVVFNPNHTAIWAKFNGWGWNYGNGPGVVGHAWMADNTLLVHADINNQGIAQGINVNLNKYATGDLGPFYLTGFSDLGSPDYSAEGTNVITAKGGQNGSYFHGTVGTGASTGGTALPIVYNASYSPSTLNRNATSSGGVMLDTSQVILASSVTGLPVTTGYGGTFSSVPIAGTVTPSTAYGVINCTMPNNVSNPNLSQSIRCPILSVQGTVGEFTTGFAVIAGDYPEKVLITAVDPKGGTTQFVTFTYTKPHAVGSASVKSPVLFQGSNVIGSYIVYDNATATNGLTIPYNVYGAPDANHIFVEQSFSQGQGAYVIYDTPTPITSLTKSGTTVTATYITSSINLFGRQPAGVVSGCSDSGLNGAATNITTDPMTLKMTFTEAAGGTGCSGALIQMPTSYRSFKLYPGAEVRSPGGVAAPATITLEPNNVAWATNDNIENAFQPFAKTGEGFIIHNTYNSLSGNSNGMLFVANGAGVSGKYNFFSLSNPNPCTIYKGCGGTLDAPIIMSTGGHGSNTPNAGFLSLAEAPLNGAPVITVGPPDPAIGGTSNVSPVNLITVTSSTANSGTLYYSPQYQSFLGPNFMTGGPGSLGTGIVTAAKFFVNGYMNDGPVPGQITFGNNVSTGLVPMGLCDHYDSTNTEVTIGNCTPIAGSGVNVTDGKINVAALKAQTSATVGNLTVGLQPADVLPASVYSGTAGSTARIYLYAPVSPLGLMGTVLAYTQVSNTAATLTASNKVTTTCPTSLQSNYPAGTTYALLARSGAGIYRNLGTCALGGTVVDDGTVTATFTAPTLNANMWAAAAQFQVAAGGGIGFYKDNIGGAMDVFINRIGVNKVGIGSSMGAAHNGTLQTGAIILDAAAGAGTQCLHADSAGNITGTGSDCGTGGGGGGSGTVTNFSSTGPGALFSTSVSNPTTTPSLSYSLTSAAPHAFFGNCSGTTGTPNYCQPSYADLGGSAPTWNQNTTGTAANLSGTPALPNGTTATTQTVGDNSTKIATTAFVLANAGGGGISGLTTGYIPQATSSTAIGNSFIDYGVTNAGAYTSSKDIYAPTFHATDTSGTGFGSIGAEGTAPSGVSGQDGMWADSTAHRWKMNNNAAGARLIVGQAATGTAGHIPVYDSSGVDLVDSGAAGVTVSGSSCTITAITKGIITGATCTP